MKKIVYVLAILAAASTAAGAKDLKQDKKATTPAVSATQMTDAEMDKVTAGSAAVAYVSRIDGQVYVLVFNPGQAQVQYPGGTYVQVNPAF
jgi:hypothetical protein